MDVPLIGVPLMGVPLIGVPFMDVSSMSVTNSGILPGPRSPTQPSRGWPRSRTQDFE
jgi:hypothetical protein